tara:strand:+ start:391 stop:1392 length:1002 start_codon:yes stop_codon:yes gene_type:complete
MAKFLNKKEQVIDFKLTNYGNYLLSNGSFKPTYYSFIDDNVVYDSAYFNRTTEKQNDIQKRIKEETQYLESLVLFEEVGANNLPDTEINFFQSDITPTQKVPRIDEFRLNLLIGDSYVAEDKQKVPSWKVVSLRSDISSSVLVDTINNTRVPQINITANYQKKIVEREEYTNLTLNTSNDRDIEVVSKTFADGKVVYLEMSEPLIYIEEVNTEVLNENFDIEVFEVQAGSTSSGESLIRKYYQNERQQIIDGLMVMPNPMNPDVLEITDDAIEKLFSVFVDGEIDTDTACKLASEFNKETFLIDLDFDCTQIVRDDIFFDIYGSETEAEICQT